MKLFVMAEKQTESFSVSINSKQADAINVDASML